MLIKRFLLVGFLCFSLAVGMGVIALPSHAADNGIALEPQPGPAREGPVPIGGLWQEFAFFEGAPSTGCFPADPAGPSCTPSVAGNSEFTTAPPWTFTAGPGGAVLKVTDAFNYGDSLEVFDFGVPIGTTPPVPSGGSCDTDPEVCFADPNSSSATFNLGPGDHSIDIRAVVTDLGLGAAYFRVDGDQVQEGDFVTHYTVYSIREGVGLNQKAEIEDQFGKRVLRLGKEKVFLVPAIKNPSEPPTCEPEVCGGYTFTCDPNNPECTCFKLFDGSGFCGLPFSCSVPPCGPNGECPDGSVCQVETCCGGPICVPADTQCDGGPAYSEPAGEGPTTTSP